MGDVVLVTGGSGFLGQHIVKLLQERASDVREIRVFDKIPYQNKLGNGAAKSKGKLKTAEMRGHWFCFEYCCLFEGHSEIKTLTYISGDVTSAQDVTEALQGVDTVIHTVGVISIGSLPD